MSNIDYTNLPDGSSRGGQAALDYVVQKAEPVLQIARDNPEKTTGILIAVFLFIAGLFIFLIVNKFKANSTDI